MPAGILQVLPGQTLDSVAPPQPPGLVGSGSVVTVCENKTGGKHENESLEKLNQVTF